MPYSYIKDSETQYNSADFKQGKPVKAVYRHADNAFDAGNPFIEALPLPRTGEETIKAYTRNVPELNQPVKSGSASILSHVSLLRQVRFPLPFQQTLEEECYTAMINSYRDRHVIKDDSVDLNIAVGNQLTTVHQILTGNAASGTTAGFHMLGYSGCGKSSTLEILFSNYPQYIAHEFPDGTRFPQITYLVVNCEPNSNFNALYESIGRAIDRALGNIVPVYEYEIQKAKGLAGKAELVRRYIEQFSVGIIVFDEIQLIDFESTRENSFEGLMTLANQTKVAMAVVGTEDAYDKMFTKLRTSRRLGSEIQASYYCANRKYFGFLVSSLFQYHWFDRNELTEEVTNALYHYSAGIVDQLIGIFMYMVIDYWKSGRKPVIDEKYVQKTVEKHYPGIQKVLSDMANPMNDAKRASIIHKASEAMAKELDAVSQDKFIEQITSFTASSDKTRIDSVVQNITTVTNDYSEKTIQKETESVLKTKQAADMDDKQLTQKVMQRLKHKTSDKRPSAKRAPKDLDAAHITMRNFVESE